VSHYCLDRVNGNGTGTPTNCPEATQAQMDTLTTSMAACFKTAVDAGLDIAISPHLDDGLGLGDFHPPLSLGPQYRLLGRHNHLAMMYVRSLVDVSCHANFVSPPPSGGTAHPAFHLISL